jgi:putative inorganic carbon (hco3(-)) transporter
MNPVARSTDAAWGDKFSHVADSWRTVSVRTANGEAVWGLLRAVVIGMLLIRAASDPVFNLLGGEAGASAMGVGAIFNALAITIAFVLFAQRPLTAPFSVIGIWGPFLLIVFGATLYAPDLMSAARLALVLLSYWSFFVIPFFIWRSPADVSRFVLVVMASSVLPSLYALVDIARGLSDIADFRLQSTFSHPNIYAFYLVLLLGLALYVRSSRVVRVTSQVRMLIALYIPVLITLLMLTKTRSAWVTCALMFLVYAFRIDRRFLAGFLLVPVLLVANPSLVERLTDVTEATEVDSFKQLNDSTRLNSYVWRQALWASAIPEIMEKPLLGHGLETFKPSTPGFFPLVGPEGIDGHNFYLQTGFEMGLLGVLALLWLLGSVGRQVAKGWRRDPDGVAVILCILVAYALECYSDNMHFYLSFNWYFWFAMGTICAWIYNVEKTPRPARASESSLVPKHRVHEGRRPRLA